MVLLLPARNEEATVARVVKRTPRHVAGHPVSCWVIDDRSHDATASRALAAGATVIQGPGRGLGAAVRAGMAAAVDAGAEVVAF